MKFIWFFANVVNVVPIIYFFAILVNSYDHCNNSIYKYLIRPWYEVKMLSLVEKQTFSHGTTIHHSSRLKHFERPFLTTYQHRSNCLVIIVSTRFLISTVLSDFIAAINLVETQIESRPKHTNTNTQTP